MTSLPYFSVGETPSYIHTYHDAMGRTVREERPDGGVTVTSYEGAPGDITVTVTETVKTVAPGGPPDESRVKLSVFDANGLLVSSTDAYGTSDAVTTTYGYDGALNLATVTVDGTQVASMRYDAAGNRVRIEEANTGVTTFGYDALGRLRSQTNAKGQTSTFHYDSLDRLTQRLDGVGTPWTTTRTWTWDPANATGALASRLNGGFVETLTYDNLGRIDRVTTDVNMGWTGFPGNGSFVMDMGYDAQGRPSTFTWPSGLAITREYTARGYLSAIRHGTTTLEETQSVDAYGQVTRSGYGNGLATTLGFDVLGRVTSIETGPTSTPKSIQDLEYSWRSDSALYQRRDHKGTTGSTDDIIETFSYDNLDRLTEAETNHATGTRILAFGYDAVGNLTSKTSSVPGDLDVTGYHYTGPHRLASAVIDGVGTNIWYDATGNITRYDAATGDDTLIDYDARGQVRQITVGSTDDQFWYGPDGERILKRSSWDDGGTQKTEWTLYLTGGYEEVYPESDPNVLYRQQVQVTDTVVHRRTVDPTFTATAAYEYRHRDHLGSVDKVTDEAGNSISDLAFDPYGGRRNPDGARDLTPAGLALILADHSTTDRGFTDHEHLDRTGFIHMNGRVYDPRTGRFVQPDPVVQAPTYSQSYNRYAYTMNSPLSYTDPSGFFSRCHECVQRIDSYGDSYPPRQDFFDQLFFVQVHVVPYDTSSWNPNWAPTPEWLNAYRERAEPAERAKPSPEPTDPSENDPPAETPPPDKPPPSADPEPLPVRSPQPPVPGPQAGGQIDDYVANNVDPAEREAAARLLRSPSDEARQQGIDRVIGLYGLDASRAEDVIYRGDLTINAYATTHMDNANRIYVYVTRQGAGLPVGDLASVLIHELIHVDQMYGHSRRGLPGRNTRQWYRNELEALNAELRARPLTQFTNGYLRHLEGLRSHYESALEDLDQR